MAKKLTKAQTAETVAPQTGDCAEGFSGQKQEQAPDTQKEPWSKAVMSLAFWLGMIFLCKWLVADVFVIPTGSMEPTLHGRDSSGDRIFCTKINYLWRTPERWEVFVFKYPYMQSPEGERSPLKGENYIKRCVALPGETVALRRGDLFISRDGKESGLQRQVKSPAVQAGMWIPVYAQEIAGVSEDELGEFWQVSGWKKENGNLVSAGAGSVLTYLPSTRFDKLSGIPDRYFRRQYVDFVCPKEGCGGKLRKTVESPMVTARCPRCGRYLTERDVVYYDFRCEYPSRYRPALSYACKLGDPTLRESDWHSVPDLRLRAKARLSEGAEIELQILDDRHICAATFRAGGGVRLLVDGSPVPEQILFPEQKPEEAKTVSVKTGERRSAGGEVSLPGGTLEAGRWYELDFQRIDGTLRLFIDGKPVILSGIFDTGVPGGEELPRSANVDLIARGKTELSSVAIDRDVYYFQEMSSVFLKGLFRLSPTQYMALGDNQPSSSDSRYWGGVPAENLVGTGQFTWWPLQAIRLLSLGQ